MKKSPLAIGFVVWAASLAYWFGASLKAPERNDFQPSSERTASPETQDASDTANTAPQKTLDADASEPSQLDAFFNGENPPLDQVFQEIAQLSGEEARALLTDAFALPRSDPNRSRMIQEILGQLAETEPMAALELANEIDSLRDNNSARVQILETWGRNDPSAAIAWATSALANEPARTRDSLLTAIYEGYAETDPAAAFQQALLIDGDDRLKNRVLGEVIETQIRNGGLNAAKLTVDQLSDTQLQNSLRRELVDEWAAFDPEAAAAYVGSLGEDAGTNVKNALVSEWAESDPAAAAAWLSSLDPEDPAVAQGSASIIREWTRYDLAASAEWLNSLPASPELDRAVVSYTFRAAEEDPATAMTWAESIGNDRRRNWMMERVSATWKEQSPDTFQKYLSTTELSDEQRSRMENAQPYQGNRRRGR